MDDGFIVAHALIHLPLIRRTSSGVHTMSDDDFEVRSAVQNGQAGVEAVPGIADVLIVGAGPAGLAAAIASSRAGLDYRLVEKGMLVNS